MKIAAFESAMPQLVSRLRKLGFVEGSRVEVLHYASIARDPIAVRVGEHTVALGRREAACIRLTSAE